MHPLHYRKDVPLVLYPNVNFLLSAAGSTFAWRFSEATSCYSIHAFLAPRSFSHAWKLFAFSLNMIWGDIISLCGWCATPSSLPAWLHAPWTQTKAYNVRRVRECFINSKIGRIPCKIYHSYSKICQSIISLLPVDPFILELKPFRFMALVDN